jgi:hypothetical protein
MESRKDVIKRKLKYWSQNSKIFQFSVSIFIVALISLIDILSGYKLHNTIRLRERQAEATAKIIMFLEKFHIAKVTGLLFYSISLFFLVKIAIMEYKESKKIKFSTIFLIVGCIIILIVVIFYYSEGDVWRSEHRPVTNWRPNFGN